MSRQVVLLFAGYLAGAFLPGIIRRWRHLSERRIRSGSWEDKPSWTWPLIAFEFWLLHPVLAWRAMRDE